MWGGQLETGGDMRGSLRLSLEKLSGKSELPKTAESCDVTELIAMRFPPEVAF